MGTEYDGVRLHDAPVTVSNCLADRRLESYLSQVCGTTELPLGNAGHADWLARSPAQG
jgi:hypothetical protein